MTLNHIVLHNSITGLKNELTVAGKTVTIYACGITPWSDAHVGHARSYVVFDLLTKLISALNGKPILARNITDIDDKTIAAAQSLNISWKDLSEMNAQKTRDLMVLTGLGIPLEPRASDHISEIIELITILLEKGFAYLTRDGVKYRVSAFKGELLMNHKHGSLLSEKGLGRVLLDTKEDLRDFALWKTTESTAPGFQSPWGWGRPGWHIECSAMIGKIFGGSVDIHGGGTDLKFPHHQSEIMQSEAVFGKPLAQIWMHNGSVLSNGQKMSKSLNNFVTWDAALDLAGGLNHNYRGAILKIALLSSLWSKPLDWTSNLLNRGEEIVNIIHSGLRETVSAIDLEHEKMAALNILSRNLNTPELFNRLKKAKSSNRHHALSHYLNAFLTLNLQPEKMTDFVDEELSVLMAERESARVIGDFKRADELRNKILAKGGTIQDRKI